MPFFELLRVLVPLLAVRQCVCVYVYMVSRVRIQPRSYIRANDANVRVKNKAVG